MQDLDGEVGIAEDAVAAASPSKRKSGRWKSVRDLARFWEAMEFRQECSSGRVVGFLWLVVRPKVSELLEEDAAVSQESLPGAMREAVSQREEMVSVLSSPSKKRRKPLSGPIISRQPRLKGGSSSLSATSELTSMFSVASGDGLVLSKEAYDKAMQKLLHLNFSNSKVATQSTAKWVAEVSGICGVKNDWSLEIAGTSRIEVAAAVAGNGNGVARVNDLGGMVRKKRKADEQEKDGAATLGEKISVVNVLSAGMIRKKPRPAPS